MSRTATTENPCGDRLEPGSVGAYPHHCGEPAGHDGWHRCGDPGAWGEKCGARWRYEDDQNGRDDDQGGKA